MSGWRPASSQLVALDKAELRDPKQTLASASGAISEPFGGNPGITAHLSDVAIDVAALKPRVEQIRDRPAYVTTILGYLSSGRLLLSDATATTTFTALQVDFIEALRRDLAFDASIRNGAFSLPEDWKIPTARELSTQLHYSKATLTATQGTASVGSSTLSDISARADFSHGFNRVPYDFSFRSDADTGELFRAAQTLADSLQLNGRDQVVKARGRLNVDAKASGVFTYERFEPPSDYEVTVEANRFQFEVKDTPGPVELRRGVIVAVPRSVRIDRLDIATTGGDGFVDGDFKIDGGKMTVHQLTVEMHQMPAGLWLPLVVPPDNIKLEGGVGGKIVVKSDPLDPKLFLIDGKLVVGQGKLSFAFLRAPIEFQAATFNFQRRSMVLALPAASLEGGAMNFKLSVADLAQPTLRIDVISQLMDFTVMKFVRLPWIPPGPPPNFPIPVVGHIEVRRGNLAKLQFSDVKADFYRHTDSAWSLYNFSGVTLKGNFAINIIGRAKDDWIQMKGAIAGLDLAALFLLAEDSSRPPMRGKLTIDADLWANTGDDFFATIDGTANVVVGKGRIERLTLLSRMLELIDLRNWLTANIPNPTKSGLPFDTAGGHFSGTEGVFFTDDFVLHGPVMTITAQGSVRMATGDLSMEMAAFPLMTVSWLADKIPIIGGNVASGTSTLLAAYFSVSGPLADPAVRLKPITSVTELVKKMIFLPINLIRPDTVK